MNEFAEVLEPFTQEIFKRAYLYTDWRLSEIVHDSYFIPYFIDWRNYFDNYPYSLLFKEKK